MTSRIHDEKFAIDYFDESDFNSNVDLLSDEENRPGRDQEDEMPRRAVSDSEFEDDDDK